MKILALVMMAALGQQDAGVDAGSSGVYRVVAAKQADGGSLGPGWYLSSDKMFAVGTKLVVLDNENRQMKEELLSAPRPTVGFWVGIVIGAATGIGGTILIVRALK